MQLHVKLAYGHDIWIENGMTGFSDLRRQKKQGFRRDVSLPRQLPSTPCSPNRPVLAKTSVIAEKNTAKKLTLGAWRQHSVIFTFLWSYFQALKSTPKIPHTQLWLEIFFFCFLGADLRLRWTEIDMPASPLSVPMFSTLLHSQSEIKQPSRWMILNVCTQASFLICLPLWLFQILWRTRDSCCNTLVSHTFWRGNTDPL